MMVLLIAEGYPSLGAKGQGGRAKGNKLIILVILEMKIIYPFTLLSDTIFSLLVYRDLEGTVLSRFWAVSF